MNRAEADRYIEDVRQRAKWHASIGTETTEADALADALRDVLTGEAKHISESAAIGERDTAVRELASWQRAVCEALALPMSSSVDVVTSAIVAARTPRGRKRAGAVRS